MSATTSPQKDKVNWVKFDNETESAEAHSRSSSSGVSSARGSVNSVQLSPQEAGDEVDDTGVLPVSETQVVNEKSLRGQKSGVEATVSSQPGQVFKQMNSPSKLSSSSDMDNVNLKEESSSPAKSDQIRGRRFCKYRYP